MKEEIIIKIKEALLRSPEKEEQISYILTEIRKLLEKENKKIKYPVLNLYCNWVVHPEIEVTNSINLVFDKIEELSGDPNLYKPKDMSEVIYGFLNLDLLSKEFGNFLSEYGIENPLTKHAYRSKFRDLLVGILQDCPLKPKNRKLTEFRFKESDKNNITYMIQFKNTFTMPGFDETYSSIVGTILFQ